MIRPTASQSQVSVLFSEPKIPHDGKRLRFARGFVFQCSSASRKFLIAGGAQVIIDDASVFQCSSASRKFLTETAASRSPGEKRVSVLFSEPKIPHYKPHRALRVPARVFQCSSASRKFLIDGDCQATRRVNECFSALQRAENSSSSLTQLIKTRPASCFSALQRAENSSW